MHACMYVCMYVCIGMNIVQVDGRGRFLPLLQDHVWQSTWNIRKLLEYATKILQGDTQDIYVCMYAIYIVPYEYVTNLL